MGAHWRTAMAEQDIAQARAGPIGLDFDTLKAQGIDALQGLCRELWTDYNLHDPGVTVLEQLVYGLTDLAYRTEFDVADYLTGHDGTIAYADLALHPAQDVFHGQALTINGYRRLLYDAIPEIGDIWVRALGNGRLSIDVARAAEVQPAERRAHLEQEIRTHYAMNRNLCEDLSQITVLEPAGYYLAGEIDTCGARPAAQVLAQILFDCANYMSSGMEVHRLRDVVGQGMPPETVYEGPVTQHGYVTAGENPPQARIITISELVGVIQRIDGVARVRRLALRDRSGANPEYVSCDTRTGHYPCLPFPTGAARDYLRLQAEHGAEFGDAEFSSDARDVLLKNRALHDDAEHELKKLQFDRHAFRTRVVEGTSFPLPAGRYRELAEYYSVQHDFPAVYGIGQYGVPHSAGQQRIAQAKELKAFLFPFEQLMANYLQNLQEIPTLFSVNDDGKASYFHQRLNQVIPGIEELLIDPEGAEWWALKEQDDYCERKGRLYDYLLAMHGDAFPQLALRRFHHYHPNDTDRWLLDAKAALLRSLVVLGPRRGTAFNYLHGHEGEDGVSVMERRVAILLGLGAGPRARDGGPRTGELDELAGAQACTPQSAWKSVPPDLEGMRPAGRRDRMLPDQPVALPVFRAGISLDNYALADDRFGTSLYCGAGDAWIKLGRFDNRREAIFAAYDWVGAFAAANEDGERLHIVEHILLWPSGVVPLEKDFFASRMSVVLPDWTARCADGDFRQFVRHTVRSNCPAHVHPTFLWLSRGAMSEFDTLRHDWRLALRMLRGPGHAADPTVHTTFNRAATALAAFLRQQPEDPQ